ncbi:MAG: ABC transporter permease [Lachnospiraceae bacterium]|nr:ABC transporter permease [Lachnospiraceae bacterium]
MKSTLLLWKIEWKHTLKCLPGMLLEAILIVSILAGIAFGAGKLLYQDEPMIQITIGVVEEEENPMTDLMLQYIQSMESISETCQFRLMSKEEAFSLLQEQKLAAVLVLPNQLVEGILTGENTPVQVYFPENAGIESALLKELTDAGVGMLQVAQAEIYGIYDTAKEFGALENLSVLEADINQKNLAFALDRLAIFQTESVSATGGLTVVQYYIASGIILFLLLLGMACYPMMQPYTSVMSGQLSRQGIGVGKQCFGKWLCGFSSLVIGFAGTIVCLIVIIGVAGMWNDSLASAENSGLVSTVSSGSASEEISNYLVEFGWQQFGIILLIIACIATFVFFIFQLANSGVTAILALFFLSIVMMYCSGGFLPSVFLPEAIQNIGKILPTTYLIQAAGSLFVSSIDGVFAGGLLGYTIVFGICAYVVIIIRSAFFGVKASEGRML